MERLVGTLLDYDSQRGFGRLQDAQGRVFFLPHHQLPRDWQPAPGRRLCFSPVLSRKGNIANAAEPA